MLGDVEYATAGWVDWWNNRRLHSSARPPTIGAVENLGRFKVVTGTDQHPQRDRLVGVGLHHSPTTDVGARRISQDEAVNRTSLLPADP
ncbi:hypothetical protein JL108_09075 [Aeromicrobium sp. YIM 150415]|nr:hypothetical protein [Aeromicrobium sp. YIM 150415]